MPIYKAKTSLKNKTEINEPLN